ncbi:phosphate/phosphite/phosphonate ABC transporter substrate-binding protein [Candidatus Venteria ishoeyi]|uniref:phosphate/phosphite/phosphonate ABC transporter substrate-binding protein n=1 Tax=Candidatus Venteria ishoeyi TaxID=1899563 RepID=UPI0025A4F24F|nr:phosphate/phosphite/phosphonate ABC transporter substrate-binding protein [Candidatus Venteria ishoeyi]MDM8547692.1 phosphate/phosphite/phosphonate ABC transporter substrate-binding protein [Candidatus Venteria ishoeyi]
MMKIIIFQRFIYCFLPCIFISTAHAAETVYRMGVVPQFDHRRIQAIWQPIIDHIAQSSGVQLKLEGSPDIPQFEKNFSTGNFDLAYMNPYHLLIAHQKQGYKPLIRDTGRSLYGIIVVHKDSPLQKIEDLAGKTIAFPAPNALGAALIPRAEFTHKFHIDVNPRYVRSHTSVYLNVAMGQAAAGGGVQKTLEQQKPEIRNKLRILYQTTAIAPHPIAIHPRVPAVIRKKITNALLQLGASKEGRVILNKVPIKTIGRATLMDYEALKNMGLEDFYVR